MATSFKMVRKTQAKTLESSKLLGKIINLFKEANI